MKIKFKSGKLLKIFENRKKLEMAYGINQAQKIVQRINELVSAESLHDIRCLPSTRLHALTGNLKNYFSIDIIHPYRLLIMPNNGDRKDLKTITDIEIIDIKDTH